MNFGHIELIGELLLIFEEDKEEKYMEILDNLLDELVERKGMKFVYEKLKSIGWTDYGLEELGLSKYGWEDEE